jgi:hypothetical protein
MNASMVRVRRAVIGLLLAAGVAVSPGHGAEAGKGTLVIDPSPVQLDTSFTLSGCGYPTPTLSFHVVGPSVDYFTASEPLADSSGCFADTWLAWWSDAGPYQITSYYRDSKGATRKVTVVKFDVTN